MLTERTQVLLSPEQRRRLERLAAQRGVSLGSVIREAVDSYIASGARPRSEALADLLALEAPVDDWKVMKGDIEQGARG